MFSLFSGEPVVSFWTVGVFVMVCMSLFLDSISVIHNSLLFGIHPFMPVYEIWVKTKGGKTKDVA